MTARGAQGLAIAAVLVVCSGCKTRSLRAFRVVPATPEYLLQTPNAQRVPFPDTLRVYNGFVAGGNGMELRPEMELRIENAYYKPGMPRRGLAGFLGTGVARYKVTGRGLKLLSIQPMKNRPANDARVDQLIPAAQQRHSHLRFYYEIFFRQSHEARGSALVSADTQQELDGLTAKLAQDPDSVCGPAAQNCTVFPEACSVSIEMEIFVNGAPTDVLWGTTVGSVAEHPRSLAMQRLYKGRLMPVTIDSSDAKALRMPLLPGDRVKWN